MNWIQHIRVFFEIQIFGVCTKLGQKLGIASRYIRLFFIYALFIANGSPLIIYLILAFWINLKKYVQHKKTNVFDM